MSVSILSAAHRRSAFAVCDFAYSVQDLKPSPLPGGSWVCARGEYECFMLNQMRQEGVRAGLNVGYPGEFREPSRVGFFRAEVAAGDIAIRCRGLLRAELDGVELPAECGEDGAFHFTSSGGVLVLKVEIPEMIAAVPSVDAGALKLEASSDGVIFEPAVPIPSPYEMQFPAIAFEPAELSSGHYDAGREIFGHVEIHCSGRPVLRCGESAEEAGCIDPECAEQRCELTLKEPGVWSTPEPLAFRYLCIVLPKPETLRVTCRAEFSPLRYRGAFSADPELARIWMHSAYTLRLCSRFFLIDGIKRDRLPWMGDLALGLIAGAYAFGDPEPVRRTLTLFGRSGIDRQHMNGIVDYSLWFLISHDLFQLYYGDKAFLDREFDDIRNVIEILLEQARDTMFLPSEGSWLFIDWIDGPKESALQVLFYWALRSAERLAGRMGETRLKHRCRIWAEQVGLKLFDSAFDVERGLFYADPGDHAAGFSRHPNFLAVLSGLVEPKMAPAVMEALAESDLPPVGTPCMAALEILALYRGGMVFEALEGVRRIWGGMLNAGATTFFEACRNAECREFYGRPFGMSLCHAWSAGPAALLPIILFGCEPLEDGWAKFTLAPALSVGNPAASVPTPAGEIEIELVDGVLEVKAPEALALWRKHDSGTIRITYF